MKTCAGRAFAMRGAAVRLGIDHRHECQPPLAWQRGACMGSNFLCRLLEGTWCTSGKWSLGCWDHPNNPLCVSSFRRCALKVQLPGAASAAIQGYYTTLYACILCHQIQVPQNGCPSFLKACTPLHSAVRAGCCLTPLR